MSREKTRKNGVNKNSKTHVLNSEEKKRLTEQAKIFFNTNRLPRDREAYKKMANEINDPKNNNDYTIKVTAHYLWKLFTQTIPNSDKHLHVGNRKEILYQIIDFLDKHEHKNPAQSIKYKDPQKEKGIEYLKEMVRLREKYDLDNPVLERMLPRDIDRMARLAYLRNLGGKFYKDFYKNMLTKNKGIVKGIVLKDKDSIDPPTIAAFYILFPITNDCEKSIRNGRCTQSSDFKLKDICALSQATALYVSWVVSLYKKGRKGVLGYLITEIETILTDNPNIGSIYMRPGEYAGEWVANKLHFKPVIEKNGDRSIRVQNKISMLDLLNSIKIIPKM